MGLLCYSCGKDYLNTKRDAKQAVPQYISDYQAILDYQGILNASPSVELGLIGSDEFYLMDGRLTTLSNAYQRNAYIWAPDIYEGGEGLDWNRAYQRILYANMALDVTKLTPAQEDLADWENVKGSALFFRAYNYFQLAQLFCRPYDISYAHNEKGLPLRLDYDVTIKIQRSSLEDTYRLIISDLVEATNLLPTSAATTLRPTRSSAYALLAKTHLQMADYARALDNVEKSFNIGSSLLDFNTLDLDTRYLLPQDFGESNPEMLFYWHIYSAPLADSRFNADTSLLTLYADNDLRRRGYFYEDANGRILFKGSYNGGYGGYFMGLANDELWLIKAECHARLGQIDDAMTSLNHLLRNRYDKDTFKPLSAGTAEEALDFILLERRKELFMRGIRWEDLRRLNKEPSRKSTLRRIIDGKVYELPADDPRWVWPIPDNEIQLSGISQNPR